jgi:hypothetical protein
MWMLSSSEITASLELFEFTPGRKASVKVLKRLLPDYETALFFGKAMSMPYDTLRELFTKVFEVDVVQALFAEGGNHSTDLQGYIVDTVPPNVLSHAKRLNYVDDYSHATFLRSFWEELDVTVAQSIKEVAQKLAGVLEALPSKAGEMTFKHMAKLNKQRPTIGTYEAAVKHDLVPDVLVILDVSGSMGADTISKIAADVVNLGWTANAHLAIVSDTTKHWGPGAYTVADVLAAAEYGGTHYETLTPILNKVWGTVITIADYDSSADAARYIRQHATGRIGRVLDLSLVNRPTYLVECVGQLADEVQPLLIAGPYANLA